MEDPREYKNGQEWWHAAHAPDADMHADICARLDAKDAEIEKLKEESRAWSIGKANVVKELEEAEAEIANLQNIFDLLDDSYNNKKR